MTDYTFILGDSLFFPKKYHQIARDRVLNFDFKRKLKTTMFASTKCRLNPHLRENFLLFTKKKCLPTYSNFEFEKMGTKKFFYHGLRCMHIT